MEQQGTEKQLVCLSKYVVYPLLKDFSMQVLGISYARFTQIEAKSTDPAEKILEVLP